MGICGRSRASFLSSFGPTAMSILFVEWLFSQERLNPKVAIIIGEAARYRRDGVGSSHDDAHRGNSAQQTGAVHPYHLVWAMADRMCSKCYKLFHVFRWCELFVRRGDASIFSVGPSR
jgi:hypothetical protein